MMTANGLVKRKLYQNRPKRYEYVLTTKGSELHPVMQDICLWANKHYPGTWVPPDAFMRSASDE